MVKDSSALCPFHTRYDDKSCDCFFARKSLAMRKSAKIQKKARKC